MASGLLKKISFLILFILSVLPSFSQKEEICIGEELFTSYYTSSLDQVASSLSKRRWWMLSNEIDASLRVGEDTLLMNVATWKNTLTFEDHFLYIYYKENLSPYFELLTTQACYDALLRYARKHYTEEEMPEADARRVTFILTPASRIHFAEPSSPSIPYSVSCYNKQQLDSVVLVARERRMIEEEIYEKKKERIEYALTASDRLAEQSEYDKALVTIDTLTVSLPEYRKTLQQKKEYLREELKKIQIALLTTEAESLFDNRELQQAMEKYQQILTLDENNETALIRSDQIQRMEEVLSSRATTFYDYSIINPDAYYLYKNVLTSEINDFVNREEKGILLFDLSIRYDTLGVNRSDYLLRSSLPDFSPNLDRLLYAPVLTPTYRENILVASSYTFQLDLRWGTSRYKLVKNNRRVRTVPGKLNFLQKPFLINYLSPSTKPNGRYFFEIKEKNMADRQVYTDIRLTKYRTVGPEAFVYSMLFPGAGTMAATQGKRGIGAMVSFVAVGGASVASFFYSRSLARKAEAMISDNPQSYDQAKYQKTLDNSKIFKYISYVGFSISGVIYIGDVIHALTRGIQNHKASREIRKSLRNTTIVVDSEDVVL